MLQAKKNGLPLAALPKDATLSDLIRHFVQASAVRTQIPILILEDIHNADRAACKTLIELVTSPPLRSPPAIVLITGRTDFSAASAPYQYLLDHLRESGSRSGSHFVLEPLTERSFRQMVAELLADAPLVAVETIERLSARVPQHVIQCIEWLLDIERRSNRPPRFGRSGRLLAIQPSKR